MATEELEYANQATQTAASIMKAFTYMVSTGLNVSTGIAFNIVNTMINVLKKPEKVKEIAEKMNDAQKEGDTLEGFPVCQEDAGLFNTIINKRLSRSVLVFNNEEGLSLEENLTKNLADAGDEIDFSKIENPSFFIFKSEEKEASEALRSVESAKNFSSILAESLGITKDKSDEIVYGWFSQVDDRHLARSLDKMAGIIKSPENPLKGLDQFQFVNISPDYAATFAAIYKREYNSSPLIFNGDMAAFTPEYLDYSKMGDIDFLVLKSEQEKIKGMITEAHIRGGTTVEINYAYAEKIMDNFARDADNPIIQIKGMGLKEYELLKQSVGALPDDMKFTLMPSFNTINGERVNVDVNFLSYTGGLEKGAARYSTKDIMSCLLPEIKYIQGLENAEAYIDKIDYSIKNKEEIKQRAVKENKSHKQDFINEISVINASNMDKRKLIDLVEKEYDRLSPSDFRKNFEKLLEETDITPITYNPLLKSLEEKNQTVYVVKAQYTLDKQTGKTLYTIDKDNYVEAGNSLKIHENGEIREYSDPSRKIIGLDNYMQNNDQPDSIYICLPKKRFDELQREAYYTISQLDHALANNEPPHVDASQIRQIDNSFRELSAAIASEKISFLGATEPVNTPEIFKNNEELMNIAEEVKIDSFVSASKEWVQARSKAEERKDEEKERRKDRDKEKDTNER